ncbi:uncharacterized protein LOC144359426 [Saccoglossus kowalevskii]
METEYLPENVDHDNGDTLNDDGDNNDKNKENEMSDNVINDNNINTNENLITHAPGTSKTDTNNTMSTDNKTTNVNVNDEEVETHTVQADEAQCQIVWRSSILISHGNSQSAGVAILVNKNTNKNIKISQELVENVALMKTATQSSLFSPYILAERAVDGDIIPNFNIGTCILTEKEQNAWWKVDLGGKYTVYEVAIVNRIDCCSNRILNSEVRVGLSEVISLNTPCGEKITQQQIAFTTIYLECVDPIVGRYVSVQIVDRSDYLNFCEFQVWAEGNAVDGNTSPSWSGGTCIGTNNEQSPWWKVDLGALYTVYEVNVINRLEDCCKTRIVGSEIRVGSSEDISENTQCGEKVTASQTSVATIHFGCSPALVGRYVSIQIVGRSDYLNFCEMQVMAEEYQQVLDNVALGKTASQSSKYYVNQYASNAVDGNIDPSMVSGTCIMTKKEQGAWWKVDLGAKYHVYEVVVTNRKDCCDNRIAGSEIRVGLKEVISLNTQCGEKITEVQASEGTIYIRCSDPILGRYVSIQIVDRSDYLNFCEMQVMAEEFGVALMNAAEDKTVTQSSYQNPDYPASNAVDGDTSPNWDSGSCMDTTNEQGAWWKVDLGANFYVYEVNVINRLDDCCKNRIVDCEIRVGLS